MPIQGTSTLTMTPCPGRTFGSQAVAKIQED